MTEEEKKKRREGFNLRQQREIDYLIEDGVFTEEQAQRLIDLLELRVSGYFF